tara:strand:+ start:259 stop:1095 length:837 start_codon:yes stop_codon:yes gene_type:complete
MKIKDILNKTAVLICGNLSSENNLDKHEKIAEHNKPIFNQFKMVVSIFNKTSDFKDSDLETLNNMMRHFYKSTTLTDWSNRGHQIGYVDLDKTGFSFIKDNFKDIKYIFKVDADYLVKDTFLNLDMDKDTDFFYQPSVNLYALVNECGSDVDKYYNEFNEFDYKDGLCPATNNFIVSTKMDFLYEDSDTIKNLFDKWVGMGYENSDQKLVLAAEHSLSKSIKRNNFKRQMMYDFDTFNKVLLLMNKHNIGDPTLKNVYIDRIGMCHWQFSDREVISYE